MGLYNKLPESITEVDVIVAGGGAAGCVVAGRLAEAEPELSVLLIESGPNSYGEPSIVHLAFWLTHMAPGDKFMSEHKSSPSPHLAGREATVPCSRLLGGGSAVNMGLYSRPQRSELDAWNTPGWSADEFLKYMNKFESFHGPTDSEDRHGYDGPLYIGPGNYRGKVLENDFINAIGSLGWPEIKDINTLDNINGPMRTLRYVDPEGKRQDVAHRYIHPKVQSANFPNLHVLVETDVERILFDDNKKAVGVAYRPSRKLQPGEEQGIPGTVKARKQVVLSAGACASPRILERSGVGSPEVLANAGVPLVSPVSGVGENYLDHNIICYPYKTSVGPKDTMDGVLSGRLDMSELIAKNDPILTWNSVDIQCKLRPNDTDIASLGPEFQEAWDREFKDFPDRPMMMMSPISCFPGDPSGMPAGQYMGVATFNLRPFARGHIHITGTNPDDYVFDTGIFGDKNSIDLKKHLWMYKKSREVMRRMENFSGEVASGHPGFPSGSKAAAVDGKAEVGQGIEYTTKDDKAIETWLRGNIGSCWHSMGTCKMAPFGDGGVVDPLLNVYGVQGLKVADLSIPPSNVGSNTCSVAMAIGEKAADIIIQELDLAK